MKVHRVLSVLMVLAMLLTACAAPTAAPAQPAAPPTVAPTQPAAPTTVPQAPAEATTAPAEAAAPQEMCTPADEATVKPVDQKPAQPMKIAVLGLENNPFWIPVKEGTLKAAEELAPYGVTVEWIVPGDQHTSEVFGQAVESAIVKKYDAIATVAGDAGMVPFINRAVDAGIPVMGHVGVTKQKIVGTGRIKLPGQNAAAAKEIIDDAVEMARQGAFALVLECLPVALGAIITHGLDIPTIGIGSGPDCDGQALVTQDMLGLFKEVSPRFLKVYADMASAMVNALGQFRKEVEGGIFPAPEHTYAIDDGELQKLLAQLHS